MLAATVLPLPAAAQDQSPPYATGGETIRGRIASIDGKYRITVRDRSGQLATVHLHQGTVINPTGLKLRPGMRVRVYGHGDGVFEANVIQTPYKYNQDLALCGPPGWWYPYGPDVQELDCPALPRPWTSTR